MVKKIENLKKVLDVCLLYLIPITNFLLALVAFRFTLFRFKEEKPNLTLKFIEDKTFSELIPDRNDTDSPDPLWQYKYRFIPTVLITNNSSKPLTIYEFSINNEIFFNNNHQIHGSKYMITLQTNRYTDDDGIEFINDDSVIEIGFLINDQELLTPVITLAPHSSLYGNLIFSYDESLPANSLLCVKTSRKDFHFELKVLKRFESVFPYQKPQLDEFD